MRLFENFRKHRALRRYVRKLPRLLIKSYGYSKFYTVSQISRTIERAGLSPHYVHYAIALFSELEEFRRFRHELGADYDYDLMRAEIVRRYFPDYSSVTADFSGMPAGGDAAAYADFGGAGDAGVGGRGH